MPELPEVEVTRRSFADRITGATVVSARLGKPLRWPLGVDPQLLSGRRVTGVGRRGKYLMLYLDEGLLLMHLGMSGSLRFAHDPGAAGIHDHFDLVTTAGVLRLHDPRRFGAVVWAPRELDERVFRHVVEKMLATLEGLCARSAVVQLPGRAADLIEPERAADVLLECAGGRPEHDVWTLVEPPEAQRSVTQHMVQERRRVREL